MRLVKKPKPKLHPKPKLKKPAAPAISEGIGWRDIRMTTDEAGGAVSLPASPGRSGSPAAGWDEAGGRPW